MLKMKINWDALGVTASLACAIHCAVLPLLGISLPLLGVDLVQSRPFEFGMIALAFVIGIYALTHGFPQTSSPAYAIGGFQHWLCSACCKRIFSRPCFVVCCARRCLHCICSLPELPALPQSQPLPFRRLQSLITICGRWFNAAGML